MPSTPAWRPRIQARASAVRNIGTDISRRNRVHPRRRASAGAAAAPARSRAAGTARRDPGRARRRRRAPTAVGSTSAAPSAAPMNGPVQGVATNAASAPVQNAPPVPPLPASRPPRGDSGKLEQAGQVQCHRGDQQQQQQDDPRILELECPACRDSARPQGRATPPRAPGRSAPLRPYKRALRASPRASSPPALARLSAFRLRIGNTHGMMLSSSPPSDRARATRRARQWRRAPPLLASQLSAVPAAGTAPGTAFSARPLPSLSLSTPSTAPRLPPFGRRVGLDDQQYRRRARSSAPPHRPVRRQSAGRNKAREARARREAGSPAGSGCRRARTAPRCRAALAAPGGSGRTSRGWPARAAVGPASRSTATFAVSGTHTSSVQAR